MNIVRRQVSKRKYVYDTDTKVFIITWKNVVNFFTDRTSENIKHLGSVNIPLPLRFHCIQSGSTVLFTDGQNYKELESFNENQAEEANKHLELLAFILENYTRIKEYYK